MTYIVSNSDDGMAFESRLCSRCKHDQAWREHEDDRDPCLVLMAVLADGKCEEWSRDGRRVPQCSAFVNEVTT